ncbi:DNA-binding transcriptional LysR family regulator [Paraburkholderia sp. 32]
MQNASFATNRVKLNFVRTLTLRQLQIFVVASRYTSFARAAEELHLTQPAVSMQIHQLEEAVGLRLFERIARKLTLTEAGEVLTHHASRILGEIKDTEDAMMSLKQADSGSINVGIVSSATYFAPKLLAMYSHLYPKVDVHFSVGNRDALLRLLQDNAIDLAIMGRPPPELDTTAEPLASHPQVVIAPLDHPLCGARRFDLQELRRDTFLLREPGSGTRMAAEAMFRQHLFTPAKTITLGSNETIKQAVMAGNGRESDLAAYVAAGVAHRRDRAARRERHADRTRVAGRASAHEAAFADQHDVPAVSARACGGASGAGICAVCRGVCETAGRREAVTSCARRLAGERRVPGSVDGTVCTRLS